MHCRWHATKLKVVATYATSLLAPKGVLNSEFRGSAARDELLQMHFLYMIVMSLQYRTFPHLQLTSTQLHWRVGTLQPHPFTLGKLLLHWQEW